MANVGPLMAESGLPVWGTPANFNRFRVLASLLQRRHWMKANQTLHYFWPLSWLVQYIYIFGGSCPLTEFCYLQKPLRPSFAFSYIGRVTARHSSSGCQPNFVAWYYGTFLSTFWRGPTNMYKMWHCWQWNIYFWIAPNSRMSGLNTSLLKHCFRSCDLFKLWHINDNAS